MKKIIVLQDNDIIYLKKNTYDITVKKQNLYLEKFIAEKIASKQVIIRTRWDHTKIINPRIGTYRILIIPTLLVSPICFSDIRVSVPLEAIDLRKPLLRGQCKISLTNSQVKIQNY